MLRTGVTPASLFVVMRQIVFFTGAFPKIIIRDQFTFFVNPVYWCAKNKKKFKTLVFCLFILIGDLEREKSEINYFVSKTEVAINFVYIFINFHA